MLAQSHSFHRSIGSGQCTSCGSVRRRPRALCAEQEPMEFSIPAEVQILVKKVREFVAAEVMPLEAVVAKRGFRASLPDLGRLRQRVKELGMFAPHLPRDIG